MGWTTQRSKFNTQQTRKDISSSPCSDRLRGPPNLGGGGLSSGIKRGQGVTLITHPHLVPRSRMSRIYTSSPPKRLHVACRGTVLALALSCFLQESKINTLTTEDTLEDPEYLQMTPGGYSLYPMHDSLRLLDAHLIFEPLLSCLGVMPQQMISNLSGSTGMSI
jgi:hypothetical protein